MKCIVLAGGSSDRLWPLSRKDYPKQFMEIREGRSMFQDTILRNIPFCDEFIIITNKKYENVVRGQLTAFQDLSYTIYLEEIMTKTAPSVIIYLQQCSPEEEVLIVPSDSIIEGDYATTVTKLKEEVKAGKFAAIVCKPKNYGEGYNYVIQSKNRTVFGARPTKASLWDTGIWGAQAGVFLQSFNKELVDKCSALSFKRFVFEREDAETVNPISLIKIITAKQCCLINATFEWWRITDISSFYNYYDTIVKNDSNTISNNNSGVEIVNMVDEQLIIANGLKNIVIVNTRDAIYVTNSTKEADIKGIATKYAPQKKAYFDYSPRKYENWGMEELIGSAYDCSVRLVTVYPRCGYDYKPKKNNTANFFIIQGSATLEAGDEEKDYEINTNITITDGKKCVIRNKGKKELVLVVTEKIAKSSRSRSARVNYLVKMQPVFKDNLWGGTKIRDYLGKDVGNMDIIAESWELSAHAAGESKIATGYFAGKTLSEYIDTVGKEKLGWKAQNYDRFPLMVKFIDAKDNLSVQVHPADEYAMAVEGEYGKNEMWHILDADDDAYIYVGFNKDVTPEEIKKRIANKTLTRILNKIRVKKGETYFLKAGTVHSIGAGCFVCEVQQSSNVTYRLYDYGRKDKNGQQRELHIDKALDVMDMSAYTPKAPDRYESLMYSDYVKTLIGQCKYFTVNQYFVDGECTLPSSESSFQVFVNIYGSGTITDGENVYEIKLGETWFCTSKQTITIKGKLKILVINI